MDGLLLWLLIPICYVAALWKSTLKPIILGAAAALIIALIAYSIMQGLQTLGWPTVPGIIHESRTLRHSYKMSRRTSYEVLLTFSYTANSKQYSNNRIQFGYAQTLFQSDRDEIERKFPPGATVQVHFNPADPQDSVLITGYAFSAFKDPILILGLLSGLFILFLVSGQSGPKLVEFLARKKNDWF